MAGAAQLAATHRTRSASGQRFRPVLITTVTTIAGLLPLTLNISDGGEFWVPLGVAIISGLLVASLLTLFVVPVLYSLLEGRRRRPRFAVRPQTDESGDLAWPEPRRA